MIHKDKFPQSVDENWRIVWDLFNGRCFLCPQHAPGSDVHELEPRSRGGNWMRVENRVVVCRSCHRLIHMKGVSESYLAELKEKRINFLKMIGKYAPDTEFGEPDHTEEQTRIC